MAISLLFVDDEETARKLFALAFQMPKYETRTASRIADALEEIMKCAPDILIMDWNLASDDPFDGIEWIPRILNAFPDIPIVMITNYGDINRAVAAMKAGAYFYSEKPNDWPNLEPILDKVREEKALRNRLRQAEKDAQEAEKARALEESKGKQDRKTFFQFVALIGRAIDAKHPYTQGHMERVSNYAKHIARERGYQPKEIEIIEMAALVHDIGKIGISESMLDNPSALSVKETAEMCLHVIKGDNILQPADFFKELRKFVRHHHEWWDGHGYPDGKKGAELPLDVWIIGVADALDAMTSDRAYRHALDVPEAMDRLRKGQGTQFAPDAVDTCISLIEKGILTPIGSRYRPK